MSSSIKLLYNHLNYSSVIIPSDKRFVILRQFFCKIYYSTNAAFRVYTTKRSKGKNFVTTNIFTKLMMQTQFKIGCSGFYNKHWKNVFYPNALPQTQWLNFLAKHLNIVELNFIFYKFPTVKSLQTWYNKSLSDFFVFH